MIYVATSHWKVARWIDIQLYYFRNFIPGCKIYLSATKDVVKHHGGKFDFAGNVRREELPMPFDLYKKRDHGSLDHSMRLNGLFDLIEKDAKPCDVVIFVDADAFPVAPISAWLLRNVKHRGMVSICEFDEDRPNASFCATTVDLFKRFGADWSPGYYSMLIPPLKCRSSAFDTGGCIAIKMNSAECYWVKLRRSNKRNIHPTLFGVYGNKVYHNGAGLRKKKKTTPEVVLSNDGVYRINIKRNKYLLKRVFDWIQSDRNFYRSLR